jgi:hypothetical protein
MWDRLRRALGGEGEAAAQNRAVWRPPEAVPWRRRVLLVIHNPLIEQAGGRKLTELFGWHDPDVLAAQYVADIAEASGGFARYEIVERIEVDGYPAKIDGFRYDDETYVRCWQRRAGFHEPDALDYQRLLAEFEVPRRAETGAIDEAWFFAFPYSGDFESTMVGRGAFWCNSPPVPNSEHCRRRFVVMAFNYERDVGCMLENFGHRVESIMRRVFEQHPREQNLWERFCRYERIAPGASECGNVHFAPNSERDYDWGNRRVVLSACDDWYNFPYLTGARRPVDCREWGNGNMRAHHLWWLKHLPHAEGAMFGVDNNWWPYVLDPMLVD